MDGFANRASSIRYDQQRFSIPFPVKDIISSWYFRLYPLGYIFRVTGHHQYGWKADSINLYQGEFYNGLESFAYDDKGVLEHDNTARLVVLVLFLSLDSNTFS